MRMMGALACFLAYAGIPAVGGPESTPILPPELTWTGKSLELIRPAGSRWATPLELNDLQHTPRYDETVEWLERLVNAAPQLQMTSIGKSAEGRDIWMIVASKEGAGRPGELRGNGRPTLLAHAGIHAGEIDGKDAGMMLLRDMTVLGKRSDLLDRANLLFIPILSVDGHERFSRFSRMNQRGPLEMGWRTNRRNLNLNRDYAKLETEELQGLVAAIVRWRPDLYVDIHVTDGADYQYDITYGYNGPHAWSPAIAGWLDGKLRPAVDAALDEMGHVPGPLIFGTNRRDMTGGTLSWTASPRFSNGWGDARHLPTVLVENHSLKQYPQRVVGTYVFLEAALRALGTDGAALREATTRDGNARTEEIVLGWQPGGASGETIDFRGVRSELVDSAISGTPIVRWTGELLDAEIPLVTMDAPTSRVKRPAAYYIPAAWYPIADKLRGQGIELERLASTRRIEAERYRLPGAALDVAGSPFEGRARFISGEPLAERVSIEVPAGTFRIDTAQALGTLSVLLLEPASPDSYFQWGYFASILQRTEYFEGYVMEPMARNVLAADAELRDEFRQKLLDDAEFAGDPQARLEWFYERTPFYDTEYRVYPVLRGLQ